MHPVFMLTGFYFAVGAAAIALIDRRTSCSGSRERWKKFAVYFLVVHGVIGAILAGGIWFPALAAVIVALGLLELLRATGKAAGVSPRTVALVLAAYGVLGLGFVRFAEAAGTPVTLSVYVVVLTFDGFSQITGQLLGRHKLAPRVSPGKTLEGLAGGLTMAAVTAVPVSAWTRTGRASTLALALLVATSALFGDLAASWVKRICRVKDYGSWIPGHGGVLDRFDSFIAAGTVYWSLVGR